MTGSSGRSESAMAMGAAAYQFQQQQQLYQHQQQVPGPAAGSISNLASYAPPPYRAPPNPTTTATANRVPSGGPQVYSRHNISEPNVSGLNLAGVGVKLPAPQQGHFPQHHLHHQHQGAAMSTSGGSRPPGGGPPGSSGRPSSSSTLNNHSDGTKQVQQGLRGMLAATRHAATLDSASQSAAMQHLRNSGVGQQQQHLEASPSKVGSSSQGLVDASHISPDTLRDAASKMFSAGSSRNQQRPGSSSSRFTSQPQVPPPAVPPKPGTGGQQLQHQPQPNENQESAMLDAELHKIFGRSPASNRRDQQDLLQQGGLLGTSASGTTPPLPAISPGPTLSSLLYGRMGPWNNSLEEFGQTIQNQQQQRRRGGGDLDNRPDLAGDTPEVGPGDNGPESKRTWQPNSRFKLAQGDVLSGEMTTMTPGAVDLEQMMTLDILAAASEDFRDNGEAGEDDGGGLGRTAGNNKDNDDDDDRTTLVDIGDAVAIRNQLDDLETMYAEVLRLLGLRKYGRQPHHHQNHQNQNQNLIQQNHHHQQQQQQGPKGSRGNPAPPSGNGPSQQYFRRNKMFYGSMSSLPSVSSIGSRPFHGFMASGKHAVSNKASAKKGPSANAGTGGAPAATAAAAVTSRDKVYNKRFQRLESHMVTLARSVAHLSSEMRSQQLLLQEVEALRDEVQALMRLQHPSHNLHHGHHRGAGGGLVAGRRVPGQGAEPLPQAAALAAKQAHRVKKLTKFFGDEPPLLRWFLKDLGYEKYSSLFEENHIGLLELPYLTEERLEKLGIPAGPRLRILQEAGGSLGPVGPHPGNSSTLPRPNGPYNHHHQHLQLHQHHQQGTGATATVSAAAATVNAGSSDQQQNFNVYIL